MVLLLLILHSIVLSTKFNIKWLFFVFFCENTMNACHCHDDKFYKNLSCALIGELINSSPSPLPSSDLPISLLLEATEYYAITRNGYFTGGGHPYLSVINNSQNQNVYVNMDIYQNDDIIEGNVDWLFEEDHRMTPYYDLYYEPDIDDSATPGPITAGINTYYAKDRISGAISNKLIVDVRSS